VFAAELQSLLAEWQKGFCQTHYELAEPLAHRAELFLRRFWTLWVKARLQASTNFRKSFVKSLNLKLAELE